MAESPLSRRLGMIRKSNSSRSGGDAPRGGNSSPADETAGLPAEWEKISPFVFRRTRTTDISGLANSGKQGQNSFYFRELGASGIKKLLFYDLETTGLSGGAGTVAFLAGFGRAEGNRLSVEQLFLSDFPGEPEFIDTISGLLSDSPTLVSYNGKSFDFPLLRSRFLMQGRRLEKLPEIDLLHHARRFWKKRLSSCSLGSIEANILSVKRPLDVPGMLVPEIYFDFLKNGYSRRLELVFEHHYQDIVSLATLLSYFERLWADPFGADPQDAAVLAKNMLIRGLPQGEKLLHNLWEKGDIDSGRHLSLYYRRKGNYTGAVKIWNTMWERYRDLFSGVELAKFLEHRKRDYLSALKIVDTILDSGICISGNRPSSDDIVYRKERLKRKLDSRLT